MVWGKGVIKTTCVAVLSFAHRQLRIVPADVLAVGTVPINDTHFHMISWTFDKFIHNTHVQVTYFHCDRPLTYSCQGACEKYYKRYE
jgi:hypothetical protein